MSKEITTLVKTDKLTLTKVLGNCQIAENVFLFGLIAKYNKG